MMMMMMMMKWGGCIAEGMGERRKVGSNNTRITLAQTLDRPLISHRSSPDVRLIRCGLVMYAAKRDISRYKLIT